MNSKGELTYTALGRTLKFGYLTSYSESFSKSCSSVPIVTLSYRDTFAVESASGLVLTLRFTRVQPPSIRDDPKADSDLWSNRFWYESVQSYLDRWQARSDGGILEYIPSPDNPYIPGFRYNGYVKRMEMQYDMGRNTEISCTLEFHVGTMYPTKSNLPSSEGKEAIPTSEFLIMISDAQVHNWYTILDGSKTTTSTEWGDAPLNCVEEYTHYGGMENPFEYVVMTLPKNQLANIAPELLDPNMIVAGKNHLYMNAVGKSQMIITKCMQHSSKFVITAYCSAYILRGLKTREKYRDTAFNWVKLILCSGEYGVAFKEGSGDSKDTEGNFIYSYIPSDEMIQFEKGQDVWYVLQVCAMFLGCKIFFAEGNAYLVDYRPLEGKIHSVNPAPDDTSWEVDLYTMNQQDPIYGRLSGSVSLGNEGVDTIVNDVDLICNTNSEKDTQAKQDRINGKNLKSIDRFNTISGDVLNVPELLEGFDRSGKMHSQGSQFIKSYLDYRCEPQQSISFTLKEMEKNADFSTKPDPVWVPYFDPTSFARSIRSSVDNVELENKTVIGEVPPSRPQKLMLSQYERKYPKGETKYYFGIISGIDLSSSTSQIVGNINNL